MTDQKQDIQVSVIVPVFRVEKELPRCVDSLLRQTERRIEIILVDDGSDDNCPTICDRYASADPRVRVIHKLNGGLSDARNAGMDIMRGVWCLFVDSDDYLEDNACERLLMAADRIKDADIIVGECQEHRGDALYFQKHTQLEEGKLYTASEYIKRSIPVGEFYMPVWLNLYRVAWLRQHGFRFAKGLLHEDLEWTPRIFLAYPLIGYVKGSFYHYIIRDGSICSAMDSSKNFDHCMFIYNEWKKQFSEVPDPKLRKMLNGFLCKCFMHTCTLYHTNEIPKKSKITKHFLVFHSNGVSSKLLTIIFVVSPRCYTKLYEIKH